MKTPIFGILNYLLDEAMPSRIIPKQVQDDKRVAK
jgi:hypothetical protein